MRKTGITSNLERCNWGQSLNFEVHHNFPRPRNLIVEAGWLFKGGEQELDASSEGSETANEDILIFFFQLDLATRVQVLTFCFPVSRFMQIEIFCFTLPIIDWIFFTNNPPYENVFWVACSQNFACESEMSVCSKLGAV